MKTARFFVWFGPVLLLCAIAFVVWLWRLTPSNVEPQIVLSESTPDAPTLQLARRQTPTTDSKAPPQQTTEELADLRPGMPRTAVEKLLGRPIQSTPVATTRNEKVTYCETYEITFTPARPGAAAKPSARVLLTLEFDATKPDHPLLGFSSNAAAVAHLKQNSQE